MPATITGRRLLLRSAAAASMDCLRAPVGWGRTPADVGQLKLSRGVGIALGHGDGVVLVPRSDELDAEAIERHREDCRVVAHEPEHGADAQGMDVLGEDLEHRHDPTVVHIVSLHVRGQGDPYRSTPGPSLKSDGTNVCGSAGSVRSASCRGVRRTSGGGSTRARDHAIWETQYL